MEPANFSNSSQINNDRNLNNPVSTEKTSIPLEIFKNAFEKPPKAICKIPFTNHENIWGIDPNKASDSTHILIKDLLNGKYTKMDFYSFPDDFMLALYVEYKANKISREDVGNLLSFICDYSKIFEKAIPFLVTSKHEELVDFLSLKINCNEDSILHYSNLFQLALPLLKTLESQVLVNILSIKNKIFETPLHYPIIFKMAIPLLESLLKPSIDERCFLACQDFILKDVRKIISLYTWQLYKEQGKENIFNLFSLFAYTSYAPNVSTYMTPLALSFELAISFLDKLNPEQIFTLLDFENKNKQFLLHNRDRFQIALPLLLKLNNIQLYTLLSTQDKSGKCPLHCTKQGKIFFPLFEKLGCVDTRSLCNICDSSGNNNTLYFSEYELKLSD